jgi:imidazolonepropionase-like amidohydrolase
VDKGTREYWSGQDPATREEPRALFYLTATRLLNEAGVPLIAGTDAGIFTNIPGSSMTRELELFVKAGLTPHEALASATRVSAETLGFEKTGMVRPGYRANLVLLSGDPLGNISALETPDAVMVSGQWLNEADLMELHEGARQTSFLRSFRRAAAMLLDQR